MEGEVFEGEIIEEQRTVEKQGQSYDEEKKPEWDLNRCFAVGVKSQIWIYLFQKCDLINRFVRICGEKMTLVLEVKKTKQKSH